jgi:hypothetical protein
MDTVITTALPTEADVAGVASGGNR